MPPLFYSVFLGVRLSLHVQATLSIIHSMLLLTCHHICARHFPTMNSDTPFTSVTAAMRGWICIFDLTLALCFRDHCEAVIYSTQLRNMMTLASIVTCVFVRLQLMPRASHTYTSLAGAPRRSPLPPPKPTSRAAPCMTGEAAVHSESDIGVLPYQFCHCTFATAVLPRMVPWPCCTCCVCSAKQNVGPAESIQPSSD